MFILIIHIFIYFLLLQLISFRRLPFSISVQDRIKRFSVMKRLVYAILLIAISCTTDKKNCASCNSLVPCDKPPPCGKKVVNGQKTEQDCEKKDDPSDPCDCPNDCEKCYQDICLNRPGDPVRKMCNVQFLDFRYQRNISTDMFGRVTDYNAYRAEINWTELRNYFKEAWIFHITKPAAPIPVTDVLSMVNFWNIAATGLSNSPDGCSFGVAYVTNPDDSFITGQTRAADRKAVYVNRRMIQASRGTQTLAHEIGHIFGLCHHNSPPLENFAFEYLMNDDVAYYPRYALHPVDINRLKNNTTNPQSIPGTATICGTSKLP
jgi:hypothetical protein